MIIIYLAMVLLSSSVGAWVEASPDRLRTLLSTILCNRGAVVLGSVFWLLILSQEEDQEGSLDLSAASSRDSSAGSYSPVLKALGFAAALALGIIERLSASANVISMERDWVVAVAASPGEGRYDLTHLNAVMRRIDLVCKLIAPVVVAAVISALGSVRVGVVFTGLTSLLSFPIETLSARRVWRSSRRLQKPRLVVARESLAGGESSNSGVMRRNWGMRLQGYFRGFALYFNTTVWIPSVALSLLHFNMLTWRATFITYLINVGYSLNTITIARAVGSLFEISSTVITPRGIVYLGKKAQIRSLAAGGGDEAAVGLMDGSPAEDQQQQQQESRDVRTLIGLQRLGLWGITWQTLNTIPVVLSIYALSTTTTAPNSPTPAHHPEAAGGGASSLTASNPLTTFVLFAFLSLSRLGVWVFDLTTQQLTQTLVPPTRRAAFAGAENAITNVFELLGAAAAIAFPRAEQYRGLAAASLATVVGSWGLYAAWVRRERGHLVHSDWGCGKGER
ncbi:Ferroporti-1 [Xylariomycetidae sp. FL2044]|nr:Ferroporti-1 [Xylariomycetidae sp. FL2044]